MHFNPRTPCGVRQKNLIVPWMGIKFQSTHPMRGATEKGKDAVQEGKFQSTHPMRGATEHIGYLREKDFLFQSTHPMRGATSHLFCIALSICISIHAPHAGCDTGRKRKRIDYPISIHAPHAGCDQLCIPAAAVTAISIHAPHAGCDHAQAGHIRFPQKFQSTHPMRGATTSLKNRRCNLQFQSTHPMRGATACRTNLPTPGRFQSTHPMRGATLDCRYGHVLRQISIHAPHAGCDASVPMSRTLCIPFQSTHPMRGATACRNPFTDLISISIHAPHAGCDAFTKTDAEYRDISIHAPHAGCDSSLPDKLVVLYQFQSTHPMRGATCQEKSN